VRKHLREKWQGLRRHGFRCPDPVHVGQHLVHSPHSADVCVAGEGPMSENNQHD
jgi:hypothetical protein